MVIKMTKLIKGEWTKFSSNKKNKILFLVLVIYLVGLVFSNIRVHENYFSKMEDEMRTQRREAESRLSLVMLMVEDENYEPDPHEVAFLNTESRTSTVLEQFYKYQELDHWKRLIKAENDKYNNLIFGAENYYIDTNTLRVRNQLPTQLKQQIFINEYLLENEIEPYSSPYMLNGLQFLIFILKGYTPLIILALCALMAMDVFLGELEEGSYKLYFTQPFSRNKIYWAKVLSTLLFIIGLVAAMIFLLFTLITIFNGIGTLAYPQAIANNPILTSLTSNVEVLGDFQIVSTGLYLLLGYSLLILLLIMTILSTLAISTILKSMGSALGLVAGIFMLNYVFDSFLNHEAILRFIQPLAYSNIDMVIRGHVNASYLVGVLLAVTLPLVLIGISYIKFMRSDLLGIEG